MANPYRLPICARVIAGVFTTHAAVSSHRGGLVPLLFAVVKNRN